MNSPQAVTVSLHDLAVLTAAIARIEALIAAAATPQPAGSDAIERIADIAFVLHERDVEASLCDALDAAVREITLAGALKQGSVERIRQAAELLRELSGRANEMMAQAEAAQGAELPKTANMAPTSSKGLSAGPEKRDGEEPADVKLPGDDLFAADVPEDDEFAVFFRKALMPRSSANEEANLNKAVLNEMPSSGKSPRALNPEDDPGDLFEPIASAPLAAPPELKIEAAALPPAPVHAPARVPEQTGAAVGESIPRSEENAQPQMTVADAKTLSDGSSVGGFKPPAPPRLAAGSVPQSAPRAAPSDPLAPVRALSDEEIIALFS